MAYLMGADLTGAIGYYANLTGADLSQANLTNTTFNIAKLTDADFTGAQVRGADFYRSSIGGTGVTLGQLYATASYQARDLTGIGLGGQQPERRELRRPEPHQCDIRFRHAYRRRLQRGSRARGGLLRGRHRLDICPTLFDG
jgi:uncharacterized protein YjbI with pentapeptide repeats